MTESARKTLPRRGHRLPTEPEVYGLACEVERLHGLARYEHAADAHHDHLICENCGRNIEVVDSQIEELQDALARKHGFKPTFHRLYLYGICPDCQRNR